MNTGDPLSGTAARAAPMALVRSGLAVADLLVVPLLALAFLLVVGAALASVGIAAGGINFVLGLRFLDFFPIFPPPARLLSGLTLLAFSVLMMAAALLLAGLFRASWRRFWSWHYSAWQGTYGSPAAPDAPGRARAQKLVVVIRLSALFFLGLLAVSFALMMLMASGPFWHAWRWFV